MSLQCRGSFYASSGGGGGGSGASDKDRHEKCYRGCSTYTEGGGRDGDGVVLGCKIRVA